MGMRAWLKKGLLLFTVLGTLACGVIGGGETHSENEIINPGTENQQVIEEQAADNAGNVVPEPEDLEPTEIVPTPKAEPTPMPKPTEPYHYTVLEQRLVVEKNGTTSTGVTCGRFLVAALGLAKNDTNFVLLGPYIYIEAYMDGVLIDRFPIGHSQSALIPPGGEQVFTSDHAKCADLRSLPMEDSELEDIDFRIGLYANEKPAYDENVPYSDLEIISVVDKPRENATLLEVTVKNVGTEPAYVYLHDLFYDSNGVPVDGGYVIVYGKIAPFLGPGEEVTTVLFSPFDVDDYKLLVLGSMETE